MGRNSTGELVQEIPQESKITELQVPPLVQVPATADRLALSLGFRLAGVQQGCHRIDALYGWLSKWTDVLEESSFLKAQPLSDPSYLSNYTSSKDATLTSTTSRTVATLTTATLKIVTLPTANEQMKQQEL